MIFAKILLAASLSMDAMAAAFSYRLKRIRMPLSSIAVIGLCSFVYAAASVWAGGWLSGIIPARTSNLAGAFLLTAMGVWSLLKAFSKMKPKEPADSAKPASEAPQGHNEGFERGMGIGEAILLGTALSIDSISAGMGISMFEKGLLAYPLLVAAFQSLFLWVGYKAGEGLHKKLDAKAFEFAPGIVLIAIALLRIF